jgi:F-type H+-transporting ATPase subunit epsilon
MDLSVLLPSRVFVYRTGVVRIVIETMDGSYGLLPRRRDFVAALVPGVLTYETQAGGEFFVAIDQGVVIKAGANVSISVRRATAGMDLGALRDAVQRDFLSLDEQARSVRAVSSKLESRFVSRFASYHHE